MASAYLSGRRFELRMPRERDPRGARFQGPVLTGQESVEERRARDGRESVDWSGKFCSQTADYDPVLRAHCRLE